MILDVLTQAHRYVPLSAQFQQAFDFFRQMDDSTTIGRHEIEGDNVYVLVQNYATKPVEEGKFEAHRKYIDIQYVHSGRETILWAPLSVLKTVIRPYEEAGDAALFALGSADAPIHLSPGQFVIFYPEDAHAPGRTWEKPCEVVKAVAKIRVTGSR